MKIRSTNPERRQKGFSLIELMISMFVLLAVFGVVLESLVNLQRRNSAENAKMDITQSTREFVDQAVRDLHQAGFPSANMYNAPASPAINNKYIAAGLVSVGPNSVQFEGDVDSNGNVQSVTIQLVGSDGVTVGGACPCTLRRGKVFKVQGSPLAQSTPTYYAELANVATTNVFTGYDQSGNAVPLPTDINTPAVIKSIKTIQMTVNVQSPQPDLQSKVPPIVSMTSEARIYN